MILKTSILLASLGFAISFGIAFQALGLDQGLAIQERLMDEHKMQNGEVVNAVTFSADGPRTYEYYVRAYDRLTLFFVLILFAKFIETTRLFRMAGMRLLCRIVSFVLLFLVAFGVRKIIVDNSYVEPFQWEALQNLIAHTWIGYPWILLFIASILLVLDVLVLFPRFRTTRVETPGSMGENGT